MSLGAPGYDVVIPTAGRPELWSALAGLAAGDGPWPGRIVLADDRRGAAAPLLAGAPASLPAAIHDRLAVVRVGGRGPAAARNHGWRACAAEWVAFLDDDVVPEPGWRAALASDLAGLAATVGGSQGRIVVPRPPGRRPTDWERNVIGLEDARWATADLCYRRSVLETVGGFDERFPRAYREDADLGVRVTEGGWAIVRGRRVVLHPVRPAPRSVSVAKQAGNADDVLMRALHGADWRARAGAPAGRLRRHLAVVSAAGAAVGSALAGRWRVAGLLAGAWGLGTLRFAWERIAPGPRTRDEVATLAWTSPLLPFAAAAWWVRGWTGLRARLRAPGPAGAPVPAGSPVSVGSPDSVGQPVPAAVLFDRDGTLVIDVPYNGDPERVVPVPGARAALERLRAAGVPTGVVSNQSGIARGLLTSDEVRAVNARIEHLLGPLGPWAWCPHGPEDGCECRKPRPGLVLRAARELGVAPERCAVVGDIGADVEAARAAGARGVLVPTPRTRPEEVAAAPEVARDLPAAVELLLTGAAPAAGAVTSTAADPGVVVAGTSR